jgi:hypothetical protein
MLSPGAMDPALEALEREWTGHKLAGAHVQEGCLGWLPYPLREWRLLMEAARANGALGPYLELGSGIGTKVLAARDLGYDGYGVENNPVLVREAERLGAQTALDDVRTASVVHAGIVYVNHPLAAEEDEMALERRVQAELKPGAVLIQVRSGHHPHGSHWELLKQIRTGDVAWRKIAGM